MNKQQLAKYIDHTILKPDAAANDISRLCLEATRNGFAAVCVNPTHVPMCASLLKDSDVAVDDGASEIDMVINIGALKDGDVAGVEKDIRAVVEAVAQADGNAIVKVIIETGLLTDDEKKAACAAAKKAGAHFVKTSTGFSGGGATVEDIALMRAAVGPKMGVKASGGVKNHEQAMALIAAGATRIGASAGIQIIADA